MNPRRHLIKSRACCRVYFIYLLCFILCFTEVVTLQYISLSQLHHWLLAIVPWMPTFLCFFPSLLCGIIWSPFIHAWNITMGKITRLHPKTTLHRTSINQMKEQVLVRVFLMMEIKDSEPCLYSSHSENSNRSITKCWKEGGMEKIGLSTFCLTFGKNRLSKIVINFKS